MQFYGTWKEIRGKSLFCFTGALILCWLLECWSSISLLLHVDYSLICHTGAMHLQQLSCLGRLPLCLSREIAEAWRGALLPSCVVWDLCLRKPDAKKKAYKTKQNTNKQKTGTNSTFSSRPRLKLHGRILIQYIHQVGKPHLKGII